MAKMKAMFKEFEEDLSVDNLRSEVRTLNQKLKLYENIEDEKVILTSQLEKTDNAREVLKKHISDTADKIKEEKDWSSQYQSVLITEN